MTTQYGFFIDSSRCTGCKTCELACKDYKDLTPEVSFRRIYEYAGGDWQEKITVSGTRTCLPTICRFHVTTAKIRLVLKSARAVRWPNVKMVLLWSMKMYALAAVTVIWLARMAHRNITKRKAI